MLEYLRSNNYIKKTCLKWHGLNDADAAPGAHLSHPTDGLGVGVKRENFKASLNCDRFEVSVANANVEEALANC